MRHTVRHCKELMVLKKTCKHRATAMAVLILAASGLVATPTRAAVIATSDIVAIPQGVTGSGNGTLNLRMFTFSGSEIDNTSGVFNGDNGNNTLPHAGGADTASFDKSYVTTAGDLKAYYNLNFALGGIQQIMLLLDLNETGNGEPNNTLAKLDVILNPASIQGNPNPSGDVSSSTQAAINQVYTGGSVIASLNPQPAANIPVNNQGAGFADYAIFTGINPYSLNDNDVLLFNISMSLLSNGSEEIFLSGSYAPLDIVPEPASLALLAAGGTLLLRRRS